MSIPKIQPLKRDRFLLQLALAEKTTNARPLLVGKGHHAQDEMTLITPNSLHNIESDTSYEPWVSRLRLQGATMSHISDIYNDVRLARDSYAKHFVNDYLKKMLTRKY